jgi:hypothetical protein
MVGAAWRRTWFRPGLLQHQQEGADKGPSELEPGLRETAGEKATRDA